MYRFEGTCSVGDRDRATERVCAIVCVCLFARIMSTNKHECTCSKEHVRWVTAFAQPEGFVRVYVCILFARIMTTKKHVCTGSKEHRRWTVAFAAPGEQVPVFQLVVKPSGKKNTLHIMMVFV
jgi:hypothetical protein